tara:strand:- start:220 stop:459 length:240 start_codon:yes stop_codon:yes gene_type:complete
MLVELKQFMVVQEVVIHIVMVRVVIYLVVQVVEVQVDVIPLPHGQVELVIHPQYLLEKEDLKVMLEVMVQIVVQLQLHF